MHIRFTSSAVDDEFQDLTNIGFGQEGYVQLNRYGDLITRLALEVTLPPLAAPEISVPSTTSGAPPVVIDADLCGAHYVNCIGFAVFESVNFKIGGSTVDECFSDYAFIFEELAGRPGLRLEESIGRVPFSSEVDEDLLEKATKKQILYVPIPLYISKYQPQTWGQALPIVALSYHDVRVELKARDISECVAVIYKNGGKWNLSDLPPLNKNTGTALVNSDLKIRLLVSSVYLDTPERLAITAVTHSFLIKVAQRQSHSIMPNPGSKTELQLFANHPSSSLIWFARPLDWKTSAGRRRYSCGFKDRYDFSHQVPNSVTAALPYGDATDPVVSASLSLNTQQRWPVDMPGVYFRTSVPHTGWRTLPSTPIYSYSFALESHTWQPTSTLNFSRLDHTTLGIQFAPGLKGSEFFSYNELYNLLIVRDGLVSGLTRVYSSYLSNWENCEKLQLTLSFLSMFSSILINRVVSSLPTKQSWRKCSHTIKCAASRGVHANKNTTSPNLEFSTDICTRRCPGDFPTFHHNQSHHTQEHHGHLRCT